MKANELASMNFPPVWLMTLFDLVIVGVVAASIYVMARSWNRISSVSAVYGIGLTVLGLTLLGGVYLYDLITMHVLPPIIGAERAMAQMIWLHVNIAWYVHLASILCIAVGVIEALKSYQTGSRP